MFISPEGFIAATPDGLVCNDNAIQVGILEIKCPYSHRNTTVIDACTKANFFCKLDEQDQTIHLKTNHNYYFQVQGQMAVLNLPWYDFVVWTQNDIHVEVNIMHRSANSWKWPKPEDKIFYSRNKIVRVINPPSVAGNRAHLMEKVSWMGLE